MRCFVLLLPLLFLVACDDTASLLAAGKVADACFHGRNDPQQRALVEQWHAEHAAARLTVVPQATLAAGLGGPIDLYDFDPLPYDVDATITAAPDARVVVDLASSRPLSSLVDRLPLLYVADRAPVAHIVEPTSLLPTPRPEMPHHHRRATDPVGMFIEGTIDAAVAVGGAIGTVLATPFIAMGSAVGGFFDAIGSIFGGGGGGSAPPPDRVPISRVETTDVAVVDALLTPEEFNVADLEIMAEHATHETAVQAERTRRLALLDDVNTLAPGDCRTGRCRVLLDTVPTTVPAHVVYESERLIGKPARCAIDWEAPVVVAGARIDASLPPEQKVHNDVDARAHATLTTTIDTGAPSWSTPYAVALPVEKAKRANKNDIARVDRLTDLDCTVVVKQKRFDMDGSTPDLLVRATVGKARPRVSTLKLGHDVNAARFIVFGADVVAGERVRLSLTSEGDRSLGGAIVTFDGTAPLVLENPAFRAVCTMLPRVDDSVIDAAVIKAEAAIKQLAADDNGIDSPRPDAEKRARRVAAAEAAVVAVAARVGWRHPAVVALVTAVASAQ